MSDQIWFILKVLIVSAVLSTLIKYGGSSLSLASTPTLVLIVVFLPSLIVAIALWWRLYFYRQID
ncbi:hypothetical protein Cri9333_1240 [Crinalium epipsammum PCC 9333]|uniref:Uncharacterized protein n=1 Tax=Crinalium epipsammum PCC 9333 TaxID=1173022 RepID=K9VYB3_9CYAN|nr:hypothetical protein [Crinalium epipsammum]AFZ12140.1 hypothetical protein Cri9333_1240 [Crinalium epipsammum PCC 9333]